MARKAHGEKSKQQAVKTIAHFKDQTTSPHLLTHQGMLCFSDLLLLTAYRSEA
jgi:hypothetical protein